MYSVFPVSNKFGMRQRGAALIMALVVFGIVAMLAASLSSDFLVAVRRVENQLHGQQASAYLRGAEGLARSALQIDFSASNTKDHISEGWLDNPQEFPMDAGVISGTVCDLQGRFNLNNLSASGGGKGSYTFDQEVFIRLLQTLPLDNPLDQSEAEEIANAIIDWVDVDGDVSEIGGAEEAYYSDLEPPYHAGNRLLNSVTELRWVRGVSDDIYQALQPHITVLPVGAPINVNAADVALLRSINEAGNRSPISESDAESIVSERDGDISSNNPNDINTGFETLAEFQQAHPLTAISGANLVVRSDYFLLDTTMLFLDRKFTLYSVMHRDANGKIKTLARAQTGLGRCRREAI